MLGDNDIPIRQLRAAERVAANAPTVINQGTLFITYNVPTRKRESYTLHTNFHLTSNLKIPMVISLQLNSLQLFTLLRENEASTMMINMAMVTLV